MSTKRGEDIRSRNLFVKSGNSDITDLKSYYQQLIFLSWPVHIRRQASNPHSSCRIPVNNVISYLLHFHSIMAVPLSDAFALGISKAVILSSCSLRLCPDRLSCLAAKCWQLIHIYLMMYFINSFSHMNFIKFNPFLYTQYIYFFPLMILKCLTFSNVYNKE